MTRHALLSAVLGLALAAGQARADTININFGGDDGRKGAPRGAPAGQEEFSSSKPGETFKMAYAPEPSRKTVFKVLAPEDFVVRVSDAGREVHNDTIPTAFDAAPGHFYRIEILKDGKPVFDKKFEAKPGMAAQLWVAHGAPAKVEPEPKKEEAKPVERTCVSDSDLRSIRREVLGVAFSNEKLSVLESAVAQRDLCSRQVVSLLGLFDFSNDKLAALKFMKPRIVDTKEAYKIVGHFTFQNDKSAAKEILAAP